MSEKIFATPNDATKVTGKTQGNSKATQKTSMNLIKKGPQKTLKKGLTNKEVPPTYSSMRGHE